MSGQCEARSNTRSNSRERRCASPAARKQNVKITTQSDGGASGAPDVAASHSKSFTSAILASGAKLTPHGHWSSPGQRVVAARTVPSSTRESRADVLALTPFVCCVLQSHLKRVRSAQAQQGALTGALHDATGHGSARHREETRKRWFERAAHVPPGSNAAVTASERGGGRCAARRPVGNRRRPDAGLVRRTCAQGRWDSARPNRGGQCGASRAGSRI